MNLLNSRKHAQLLIYILLFLQVSRVAHLLAQHLNATPEQGLAFALVVAWAISVASNWTRTEREQGEAKKEQARVTELRTAAWITLVFFVVIDGLLNLTDVMNGQTLSELDWVRWVYGLTPTIGAALLGILQGRIDKFPTPPNPNSLEARVKHISKISMDQFFKWLEKAIVEESKPKPPPGPVIPHGVYKTCPGCHLHYFTRYEWAGHAHACAQLKSWKIANPGKKP